MEVGLCFWDFFNGPLKPIFDHVLLEHGHGGLPHVLHKILETSQVLGLFLRLRLWTRTCQDVGIVVKDDFLVTVMIIHLYTRHV